MYNNRKLSILLAWTIVILWMVLLYNLSAQPAQHSNKLSKGVTERIVKFVEKVSFGTDFSVDRSNHVIRKYAHFFNYLILAILVLNALRKSGMLGGKIFVVAIGISVFYAASDEFHQLFVPGRGAQVKDVFIDSAGAMVGMGLYRVVNSVFKQ